MVFCFIVSPSSHEWDLLSRKSNRLSNTSLPKKSDIIDSPLIRRNKNVFYILGLVMVYISWRNSSSLIKKYLAANLRLSFNSWFDSRHNAIYIMRMRMRVYIYEFVGRGWEQSWNSDRFFIFFVFTKNVYKKTATVFLYVFFHKWNDPFPTNFTGSIQSVCGTVGRQQPKPRLCSDEGNKYLPAVLTSGWDGFNRTCKSYSYK